MNRYQKGFTIIELVIVTAIMGLVIGGVIAIYIMGTTAWKEGSVQVALQRGGSIAVEKMIRGVDGTNGIREASSVELYTSDTVYNVIRYTSGIDSQERSFYLSSGEIMYDPNTSISDDEFSIAENVTGLTFAVSDSLVTIDLNLEGQVIDRTIKVDLSTEVKLRN